MPSDPQIAIDDTRAWLERAVIGLNLCPFAKAVHAKGQVRYVVSEATEAAALSQDLAAELDLIAASDASQHDTTLLIVPYCLQDFLDFNDYLGEAERLLARRGLEGEVQLASFHPRYRFAGTRSEDMGNYSNRSPYPMLHLLREESVERAVAAFPAPEAIFEANIRTLERLGPRGWRNLDLRARLSEPARHAAKK